MTQIEYAPEPWELVRELVDVAFPALEHDREDVLEGFPLLNRATFATFYQVCILAWPSTCFLMIISPAFSSSRPLL